MTIDANPLIAIPEDFLMANYWLDLEEVSVSISDPIATALHSKHIYDMAVEIWWVSRNDVVLFMDLLRRYLKPGELLYYMPAADTEFYRDVEVHLENDDFILSLYSDKSLHIIRQVAA